MPDQSACTVPGCREAAVAFRHFPTVVGLCAEHGGVLANFLSLIDAPGIVGFDGARARWEKGMRRDGLLRDLR